MEETQGSPVFLRPRFQINLKEEREQVISIFKNTFKETSCKYTGKVVDGHIVIDIPKEENHFWSPQLHIEIEKVNETSSLLKGLFGPKPQVWTLFMFIHFGVAMLFIGFLIRLYVQWTLKIDLTISFVIIICLPIIWFILYFLGRIGKSTGNNQMQELHDFMESVVKDICI